MKVSIFRSRPSGLQRGFNLQYVCVQGGSYFSLETHNNDFLTFWYLSQKSMFTFIFTELIGEASLPVFNA